MTSLTKILSVAGAAACLATPLAASAQPTFHHASRGPGFHERTWVRPGWGYRGWGHPGWGPRGWGPAFYGMPAPMVYGAPAYGPGYAPGPVAYEPPVYERDAYGPPAYEPAVIERPVVEQRVYRRPAHIVRAAHRTVRHAVHRAVSCAVPAHRR